MNEQSLSRRALLNSLSLSVGAIGATGTLAANRLAREADLVIAVGTRLSDFTTMSNSVFQHADVKIVAINVCEMDAHKRGAIAIVWWRDRE